MRISGQSSHQAMQSAPDTRIVKQSHTIHNCDVSVYTNCNLSLARERSAACKQSRLHELAAERHSRIGRPSACCFYALLQGIAGKITRNLKLFSGRVKSLRA